MWIGAKNDFIEAIDELFWAIVEQIPKGNKFTFA